MLVDQSAVPIEDLVRLPPSVALLAPDGAQHWERPRSLNAVDKIIGKRSVENDGDEVPARHRAGEALDAEDLQEVDRFADDPLEFGEAGRAPLQQRERTEAYDPLHGAILRQSILGATKHRR